MYVVHSDNGNINVAETLESKANEIISMKNMKNAALSVSFNTYEYVTLRFCSLR